MNKFLRGLLAVHTLGISEAVIRGKVLGVRSV